VERLEVRQARGELWEELTRRRGSHEDFERAEAVLREQGQGDALHEARGDYLAEGVPPARLSPPAPLTGYHSILRRRVDI
jgi:hypothetical protein